MLVVDAEHDRDVRLLRGRGDDDLLGAGGQVLGRAIAVGEDPGGLEDDVHAQVLPGQLRRVLDRQHLELVAVDRDALLVAFTSACRLPSTESYFSRCASVFELVRSLTATKSTSFCPIAARMMLRPMRPNPLIPTFTAIASSAPGPLH